MHRLSPDVRLLVVEVLVPILLIGALDVGFAAYVARTPQVPVPQLFTFWPVTSGKFLAFRKRAREQPALDVLLLGMSQMMRVNGQQLEAELTERMERPVRTFNFSGPFHSFAIDRLVLRDIVLPLATPAVIVYGLTPQALLNESLSAAQVDRWAQAFPAFGLYTGSPAARLRAFAQLNLALLQHREVIRDALSPPFGWKSSPFSREARGASPSGDVPLMEQHMPFQGLNPFEQQIRQRFEDFDRVLRTTRLFDHLEEFARFCHARGIALVLLSQPVHPLFLDLLPGAQRDYERYLTRLRGTAAGAHVRLFEPIASGIGPPDVYQDTVHHDPAGGAWLTDEVARYLIDNALVPRDPAR